MGFWWAKNVHWPVNYFIESICVWTTKTIWRTSTCIAPLWNPNIWESSQGEWQQSDGLHPNSEDKRLPCSWKTILGRAYHPRLQTKKPLIFRCFCSTCIMHRFLKVFHNDWKLREKKIRNFLQKLNVRTNPHTKELNYFPFAITEKKNSSLSTVHFECWMLFLCERAKPNEFA